LVGVEALDQEKVAKILGVSYEAFRQRLSRARAQLAEQVASSASTSSGRSRRRSRSIHDATERDRHKNVTSNASTATIEA
jgi:hypothetical protein